ncbi:hypothetical protein SGPA1_21950 [Streptomyces misionensis JCM 4497]
MHADGRQLQHRPGHPARTEGPVRADQGADPHGPAAPGLLHRDHGGLRLLSRPAHTTRPGPPVPGPSHRRSPVKEVP